MIDEARRQGHVADAGQTPKSVRVLARRVARAARATETAVLRSAGTFALKRGVHRPRPRRVPRMGSAPTSSSMPSSQTAGAVAYATAASWQCPAIGLVAGPLALAIAWSRAATGRHFPNDIAAGTALGLVIGTAVHHAIHHRCAPVRAQDHQGETEFHSSRRL